VIPNLQVLEARKDVNTFERGHLDVDRGLVEG
jgi:hypothetical protein